MMPKPGPKRRFDALDELRGVAIILAMLDHVKVQFVTDIHVLVPLTRLATPAFIIIFGAMIEIAYLSSARDSTSAQTLRWRMAQRLVTVALLFLLLTAAAVVSGNLDPLTGLQAALCLTQGRFSEIFLIYAALFALILLFWRGVLRHGSALVLIAAALGWGLWWVLNPVVEAPPYIMGFLFGIGQGYGPAILPGLTFLGFGMALGEALTGRRSAMLPALLLGLALVVVALELQHGILESGRRFLAHRWTNHPGYFAVGIVAACGMLAGLVVLERAGALRGVRRWLGRVGVQTLFIYGAGNLVLNLLPDRALPHWLGIPVAALFLGGLLVLAVAGREVRNRLGLGLPALWQRGYAPVRDAVAAMIAAPRRPKVSEDQAGSIQRPA